LYNALIPTKSNKVFNDLDSLQMTLVRTLLSDNFRTDLSLTEENIRYLFLTLTSVQQEVRKTVIEVFVIFCNHIRNPLSMS
jgi:hypothetical protein